MSLAIRKGRVSFGNVQSKCKCHSLPLKPFQAVGGKRPPNVKQAKEDLGNGKTCEQATWAQAQTYLEMAKATHMKA